MAKTTKTRQTKAKKSDSEKPSKKIVKAGLSLTVYGLDGKEKTPVQLPKDIFAVEVNPRLIAQYVRVYQANQRQGTASTKTRGEVIGSTRKIYKQKGTGNARHGSKKAPIFVGGGVVGGPRPRDYSLKLNSKQTKLALFNSLTLKLKEQGLFGLGDDFMKMEVKTNKVFGFLKALGIQKEKILFILPKMEKSNLVMSSRNIANITVSDVVSLNPFEILRNKKVFIAKEGLQVLTDHFLKKTKAS